MKVLPLVIAFLFLQNASFAQAYTPKIEPCPCMIKVDTQLISRCGYLVVPENRQKPGGRTVKVPFVFVRKPGMDSANNITLYTTGGPGYSTTANFDSITYRSDFLLFGGFIAFDQRGTKRAQPCLDCAEVPLAEMRAYRENLSKDSLEQLAVQQCRKRLSAQGINLSSYNTIESAADINDLRQLLNIQFLNLFGISYSGGLMLTVARNHPQGIRSLILNSPLPGFVNYEEHGLFNMNEAINQVFDNYEADSAGQYGNLRERFHQYFSSITGKRFTINYTGKGNVDEQAITYTKNELLDAIFSRMNNVLLKRVPFVMNEIISGNHTSYVAGILNDVFSGNSSLSHGMRYSMYCTEQIAYADKALVQKQDSILPWFAGYAFNNVDHNICSCWKVKPEPPVVKTPVYSGIPVLIVGGDADPWCRPFYNRLIKRTMPNAQVLTIHNNCHGARLVVDGVDYLKPFMQDPYKKLVSGSKNVIVE